MAVIELLICAATRFETSRIEAAAPHLPVLHTGIGAVNAAYQFTRFAERNDVRRVIVCGIGGAYRGAGLAIGDVACAESECFGDLGAETPAGFLDLAAMNLPGPGIIELPLVPYPQRRVKFVTVNACTGVDALADAMERRTGPGAIENMEGAAIALIAREYGIAAGEIRGISNFCGNRDRASWRIPEAAEAAQQALLTWIQTL